MWWYRVVLGDYEVMCDVVDTGGFRWLWWLWLVMVWYWVVKGVTISYFDLLGLLKPTP